MLTDSTGHIGRGGKEQTEMWAQHFADFPDVVYVRTPAAVKVSGAFPAPEIAGSKPARVMPREAAGFGGATGPARMCL